MWLLRTLLGLWRRISIYFIHYFVYRRSHHQSWKSNQPFTVFGWKQIDDNILFPFLGFHYFRTNILDECSNTIAFNKNCRPTRITQKVNFCLGSYCMVNNNGKDHKKIMFCATYNFLVAGSMKLYDSVLKTANHKSTAGRMCIENDRKLTGGANRLCNENNVKCT